MRDGRLVFLDTNVLLTATAPSRQAHARALAILNEWPNNGTRLYISGQIVREYLVVATRRAEQNGLGLTLAEAMVNVRAFKARCTSLEEPRAVSEQLLHLVCQTGTTGKQIHDANVVATALVYGIAEILTQNGQDFQRFASLLKITDLAA